MTSLSGTSGWVLLGKTYRHNTMQVQVIVTYNHSRRSGRAEIYLLTKSKSFVSTPIPSKLVHRHHQTDYMRWYTGRLDTRTERIEHSKNNPERTFQVTVGTRCESD